MSKEESKELVQKECILCHQYYFDVVKSDMRCPECKKSIILQLIKDDFEEAYGRMLMNFFNKYTEYGRSYLENTNTSYYLRRLKEEIEEYEKNPSMNESLDIGNFGLMLVYHHLQLEKGSG